MAYINKEGVQPLFNYQIDIILVNTRKKTNKIKSLLCFYNIFGK